VQTDIDAVGEFHYEKYTKLYAYNSLKTSFEPETQINVFNI
jgi:hypothetical protein